jgi:hypothetical protein
MSDNRISVATRVDRWCVFYTRGLPDEIATDRQEELRADVVDHIEWGRGAGSTDRALSRAILWRAFKGILSDLSWRRAQLRMAEATGLGTRLFAGWLLLGASVLGAGLVALALTAVARDHQGLPAGDGDLLPTLVAALVISCGLVLLLRPRTRWLGAVWIAAGAPTVATTGANLLVASTTVMFHVATTTPLWNVGEVAVAAFLLVFYAAAAMWWMPERKKLAPR